MHWELHLKQAGNWTSLSLHSCWANPQCVSCTRGDCFKTSNQDQFLVPSSNHPPTILEIAHSLDGLTHLALRSPWFGPFWPHIYPWLLSSSSRERTCEKSKIPSIRCYNDLNQISNLSLLFKVFDIPCQVKDVKLHQTLSAILPSCHLDVVLLERFPVIPDFDRAMQTIVPLAHDPSCLGLPPFCSHQIPGGHGCHAYHGCHLSRPGRDWQRWIMMICYELLWYQTWDTFESILSEDVDHRWTF